nr:gp58-like family protein [Heyndrickxia ginsengihumi]
MATVIQFNTLSQTLDSTVSRIGNAEGNISALQQTSSSFATRITDAEGNISTLTQTVDGLQETVSTKVDEDTYNSFVTQTAQALQSKLSVQDAASTYATQSSLTQTANSLTSKITSVQTNLDNLQVGVRNLALQTGNPFTMSSFSNINNQTAIVYNINQNELNGHVYISCDVTVSGIVGDSTTGTPGMRLQFYTYDNNNTSHWDAVSNIPLTDGAYKISVPLPANYVAGYKQAYVQLRADYIKSGTVTVKNFMVTIGNRYVGWSPAPEDLATQSQISQLSDDINLRVQKNDVINQINVSTESILIAGNKVHITGQTTIDNAVITSAMIQSIDAGKITAGTLDASKVSVVNLNASNIKSGTLNAITINGGTGSFTGKVQTIYTSGGNTLGTEMFSGGMYAASSYGNTVEYGADSIQLKSYPSSISVDQSSIYNSVSNNRGKETLTTDISPASITLNALTTAGQYLTGKYLDIEVTTSKADISSNVDLYVESLSGDLYLDSSAFGTIYIGGNTINLLGKVNFTWDSFNSALTVSKAMQVGNIRLNGANTITNFSTTMYVSGTTGVELSGSGASLSVGSDSSGARIYSPSFSSRTYTSSANAHITSAGVIGKTSSARKYKLDEQQVPDEISYRILNVVPKTWFDKRTIETYSDLLTRQAHGEQIDWDAEDIPYIERVPGVVAEDVEDAGLNQYVIYSDPDENGTRTIESVMYDRLWTLLIPIAKDHNDQISILLEQNQNLILKIAELESRLAKLEVA